MTKIQMRDVECHDGKIKINRPFSPKDETIEAYMAWLNGVLDELINVSQHLSSDERERTVLAASTTRKNSYSNIWA